jgi:hypothetical protein
VWFNVGGPVERYLGGVLGSGFPAIPLEADPWRVPGEWSPEGATEGVLWRGYHGVGSLVGVLWGGGSAGGDPDWGLPWRGQLEVSPTGGPQDEVPLEEVPWWGPLEEDP